MLCLVLVASWAAVIFLVTAPVTGCLLLALLLKIREIGAALACLCLFVVRRLARLGVFRSLGRVCTASGG